MGLTSPQVSDAPLMLAAERCSLPTHMFTTAPATQGQSWFTVVIPNACTGLQITWANFILGAAGGILPGSQALTIKAAIEVDGVVSNLGTQVIAPGAEATFIYNGTLVAGSAPTLRYLITSSAALTSWPTGVHLNPCHRNEFGTGLADRTLSASWFPTTPSIRVLMPPVRITSMGLSKSVEVWGDSIGAGGTHDEYRADVGFVTRGLHSAGIPYLINGADGMPLAYYTSGSAGHVASKARRWSVRQGAISHVLIQMGTNDFAQNRNAVQLYADVLALKTQMDSLNIRIVPCTVTPRTNAANTALAGWDGVNVWTYRRAYNDLLRANNGVGYGFIDVAALTQNPLDIDKWRTDLAPGYNDDGIHMQSQFQALVADELAAKLPVMMGTWIP